MARTTARVDDLEGGRLPPVCAKTGAVAEEFKAFTFTSNPSWSFILLLFGIFPFLIAWYLASTRVVGLVPMSHAALRRGRSFTWTYAGLFMLGGVLTVLGLVADRDVLLSAGVAVVGFGVITAAVGWLVVWPTGRPSGDLVHLSFVHKRFAQALDEWYARR